MSRIIKRLTLRKEHGQEKNAAYSATLAIASAIIAKKQFPALLLIARTLDFSSRFHLRRHKKPDSDLSLRSFI